MLKSFEKNPQTKPTEEKIILEEKELKERLERFETMARVIGEDFDMKIEIGKMPGWRYIFNLNKIEVDPDAIKQKPLEYCFGVIAHEASHRKISRIDFIPKKIWQERGFSYLMNAIEDPRVNNWVMRKYDGAKDWLEKVYNEDLPPEEKVSKTAQETIGYIPKHIQFGIEVIRYWHTGKFSDELPKEVKEVLEKTIKYCELAYQNIPDIIDPSNEEIIESAKRMYRVVYSKVWPEYQKLVDQSFEDEKIRQTIKEMIENGEIELPAEARRGRQRGDEEKEIEVDEEPLPLDQMPEDLREQLKNKIKKKLEGMTPEERKKFEEEVEKKAEEALDELEEEVNKEVKGKLSEQPETRAEEKRKREREKETEKRRKELEEELVKIEKEMEKKKTEYQKAYEEVKPYIDKVSEDLINLLIFERWPQFEEAFPGQRLRLKGAFKYEGERDYRELFETKQELRERSFSFLLLVDLSGSMAGEKIEEAFKGAVLFAEALNRAASVLGNLEVAIYGFQDDLIKYKDFKEGLNEQIKKEISLMKREVYDEGKHNKATYNNDGYCLDKASKILEKTESENQFLFVISDGKPEGDSIHHLPNYNKSREEEELLAVVKKISEQGHQKILGIGLGPGTEHVTRFYSSKYKNIENIPNVNIKELANRLASKLEELIK